MNLFSYSGIYIFFISLFLSSQLNWIVRHDTFYKFPLREGLAVLAGFLFSYLTIKSIRRFSPFNEKNILKNISLALTPGLLFLFFPFHARTVCLYRKDCNYFDDRFILLSVILSLVVAISLLISKYFKNKPEPRIGITTSIGKYFDRYKFWLALTLTFALLCYRGWARFTNPELYAEGAIQFVNGALNFGWSSLLFIYDGYPDTLPRVIANFARIFIPIKYLPVFTVTSCYLIAALVASFICRNCYRWLIPSDMVRICICALFCLLPGLNEMLGNLTNLHYLLFMLYSLLYLKDPKEPFTVWELTLALMIVLSAGLTAVLLPVAFFRFCYSLQIHNNFSLGRLAQGLKNNVPELFFLLISSFPLLFKIIMKLLMPGSSERELFSIIFTFSDLLTGLANTIIIYIFLHPFAGTVTVNEIILFIPLPALIACAILVFSLLIYFYARDNLLQFFFLASWIFGILAIPIMIFYLRPEAFSFFLIDQGWNLFKWWMRYNYIYSMAGVILWICLLRPVQIWPLTNMRTILSVVLIAAYISQAQYYFQINKYGEEKMWAKTSDKLQRSMQTGKPSTVGITSYPAPEWYFKYYADREEALKAQEEREEPEKSQ